MRKTMALTAAAVVGFNALIYLASPYYGAWRIMQSVTSGSPAGMQRYIDFPSVQASLRQQVDTAFATQVEQDPMAAIFAEMLRPTMDSMIDDLVQPEKLAQLIQSGKLQAARTRRPTSQETAPTLSGNTDISWYAFFDRPNRFRISAGDVSLYMEMRQWRWQLTAIGLDGLLDMDAQRGPSVAEAKPVSEEIDTLSPPPPRTDIDREKLKASLAESFFITNDFADKAMVEGDFHYVPLPSDTEIEVTWLDARDTNGNVILGTFSEEELEKRERFRSGRGIFQGRWQDEIPKSSTDGRVVTASGLLKMQLPSRIAHISLDSSQLNQLQVQGDVGANLTRLENGNVALSLYQPFDQAPAGVLVYVRNAEGLPLRKPSSSSVSPAEAVASDEFRRPMRATRVNYTVAGTPARVDVYFTMEMENVEVEFTATAQPEVTFGELKTPILQTRYAPPRKEKELSVVEPSALAGIQAELLEQTSWDNKVRRSLHFTLPEFGNSVFARLDFGKLEVFKGSEPLDFNPEQSRTNIFDVSVSFLKDTNGSTYEHLTPDRVGGSFRIRYPARIESVRINQGETVDGATLEGSKLSYPQDSNFPSYNFVFAPRSANAYDSEGRQIAYLPFSESRDGERYSLYFWGEPAYVELKSVTEWIETEIPVNLSQNDLRREGESRG